MYRFNGKNEAKHITNKVKVNRLSYLKCKKINIVIIIRIFLKIEDLRVAKNLKSIFKRGVPKTETNSKP